MEGASHAHELVEQSKHLGYGGIAITDRNSLAGVVRAFTAAKDFGTPFYAGCELNFIDGPSLVVWPADRVGYAALCRILSLGRRRASKGECVLSWDDVSEIRNNNLLGLIPRTVPSSIPCDTQRSTDNSGSTQSFWSKLSHAPITGDLSGWVYGLNQCKDLFGERLYLLSHLHRGVDDRTELQMQLKLSRDCQVPLVAAGDVLYHVPERMILQDCLTAIATGNPIESIASIRPLNAQRSLRSIAELQILYREAPECLARTLDVANQIEFRLDQLRYEYPVELAPDGLKPIEYLKRLAWTGAKKRYSGSVPDRIIAMLRHELQIIEDLHYEPYFLTVWDLVRFARSRNILCQGRGSAANSAVCYCLGVTSVDPSKFDLLFERFISRERNEAPDIDVDFEHQRREEVIQYVYEKYGRDRAGMTAAVTTYRIRSAVRDCGKAIGLSQDSIDTLAKIVEGHGAEDRFENRCQTAGIDPASEIGKRFVYLVQSLLGFPRHLSQHTGGMVITQGPLCEICPIENAAMPDRTIIQWDKNDLDELGILKVDCLALGMLSAIHRSLDLLKEHYQLPLTLATVPPEDPKVYDMICEADTIGVFQIESRAQMSMLPRLRPRCFYDLVIEVAIVRPGPIQGQMVHPYLTARRSGIQPDYPNESIAEVLRKTMGVPIFQEQAMRLAVVAAGFTPGEADQLRRAMAAWRRPGVIDDFRRKLIDGMKGNGLDDVFAERVFNQLRGFGEYGFPESHAASFALLVYVSCWIKYHYPDVFCCAMLNSQPLGFYAPSQLVQDAQRHDVQVLPADINSSAWDCTLEPTTRSSQSSRLALRLGLRMIRGLRETEGMAIHQDRTVRGPYRDQSDLVRRVLLQQPTLSLLAEAGALQSLSGDRRAAYWQSLAREKSGKTMPLFEASGADTDEEIPMALAPRNALEEVYCDYESVGVSLRGHPIQFFRIQLQEKRVTTAADLKKTPHGRLVRVAGLVLLRQRPSTAKGITFVTLEDETGSINLVLKPDIWTEYYPICKQSNVWFVHGILENRENVIHVVVARVEDLQSVLGPLDTRSRDFR